MIIEAQKNPTVQKGEKDVVTYKNKGVTNIYARYKKENVNERRQEV